MLKKFFLLAVLTYVFSSGVGCSRVLFIGNSYSFELKKEFDSIIPEDEKAEWESASVTTGGYLLTQHIGDLYSAGHTQIQDYLDSFSKIHGEWDYIVLQEQSLVAGMKDAEQRSDIYQSLLTGVREFKDVAATAFLRSAGLVIYQTWGRRDGYKSASFPFFANEYPDFKTMQSKLTTGYDNAVSIVYRPELEVLVARVGQAFEAIYDNEAEPTASGSFFYNLYSGDGSHPSAVGWYLVAVTMYATISGNSAYSVAPKSNLPVETQCYVQRAVDKVISGSEIFPSPFNCASLLSPTLHAIRPGATKIRKAAATEGKKSFLHKRYYENRDRDFKNQKYFSCAPDVSKKMCTLWPYFTPALSAPKHLRILVSVWSNYSKVDDERKQIKIFARDTNNKWKVLAKADLRPRKFWQEKIFEIDLTSKSFTLQDLDYFRIDFTTQSESASPILLDFIQLESI
eukprot:TRINITY_DN6935_c0_g1_i1.p1 TRINITY_DN6935_c0_g1~~TRINITY_DN6935_c0_g1_i1.p1  ORF type:complete len:455 (+),score=58.79 TRINITY_DN6935_c0_g1_i1:984-2348(+)